MFAVYEDGKYITGVLLKRFNGDSDKAKALASELGQYMIQNDVQKQDVIRLRDERLVNIQVFKRPACAKGAATTQKPSRESNAEVPTCSSPREKKQKARTATDTTFAFHDMSLCPSRGMMDMDEEADEVSSTPRTPPNRTMRVPSTPTRGSGSSYR